MVGGSGRYERWWFLEAVGGGRRLEVLGRNGRWSDVVRGTGLREMVGDGGRRWEVVKEGDGR